MNILMVTPTYYPKIGGIENHVKELSLFLKKLGYNVTILVINNSVEYKEQNLFGINTFYVKGIGKDPYIFFYEKKINSLIKEANIIHLHDPHIGGITAFFILAKIKYKKPLVLSSHGGFFHTKRKFYLKKFHWYVIARNLLKFVDKVIAVSESDKALFSQIVPSYKLTYIPNGIDLSPFLACRKNLVDKSFLYFGRFSENKGILTLIKVFDRLIKLHEDIKITFVGDGSILIKNKLISFARKYPNNVKVKPFFSAKEDLIEEICKHTFFVSASKYEGFGLSILEAAAAGKICIVNDIAPLNKIFTKQEIFFINFNDINNAIKSINSILQLPEEVLLSFSYKAQKKAKDYDWNRLIYKFDALYKSLLK